MAGIHFFCMTFLDNPDKRVRVHGMKTTRYSIHAYEARLDRLPGGPCEDIREPACCECDDTGLAPCGCTFGGREPADECLCEGSGCTFCDCDAGERREHAWRAKRPDYYTADYSAVDDIAW